MANQTRGGRGANKPQDDRPTKNERKDQARLEREQIHAHMARRKRARVGGLIVGLGAAAIVVVLLVMLSEEPAPPGTQPSGTALPGMMTSPVPWGANLDELGDRLTLLNLPAMQDNSGHAHNRLFLYVNGEPVAVPVDIGWNEAAGVVAPLHTHDDTGTLHIESADPAWVPTLGTFFDVWGLRMTADCIGAYCTQGDDELRVFVDGEPFEGDPRSIVMEDQKTTVIAFGAEDELPDPVPDSFTFGS